MMLLTKTSNPEPFWLVQTFLCFYLLTVVPICVLSLREKVPCIDNGKFYRNPNRDAAHIWSTTLCKQYYLCIENEVFSFKCSTGLNFDVNRQICDFKVNIMFHVPHKNPNKTLVTMCTNTHTLLYCFTYFTLHFRMLSTIVILLRKSQHPNPCSTPKSQFVRQRSQHVLMEHVSKPNSFAMVMQTVSTGVMRGGVTQNMIRMRHQFVT